MIRSIANLQPLRFLQCLVVSLRGSGGMENLPSDDTPLVLSAFKSLVIYTNRMQRCASLLLLFFASPSHGPRFSQIFHHI